MLIAVKKSTLYPNALVTYEAVKAPAKIPIPIIKLFVPRYVPSNPLGMVLNRIIEFEVLKIENATIIRHPAIVATVKDWISRVIGINKAATKIPKILGIKASLADFSSPILAVIRGTTKKTASNVIVWKR